MELFNIMATNKIESHRLYRSETNRILGGVCGGLAEYFNVDPTIIRIIFVLMAIFGGSGLLVYFILWLVIPSKSSNSNLSTGEINANIQDMKNSAEKFAHDIKKGQVVQNTNNRSLWAFIIVILGVAFLLNNYGYYDFSELGRLWPVILIIFGLSLILRKK